MEGNIKHTIQKIISASIICACSYNLLNYVVILYLFFKYPLESINGSVFLIASSLESVLIYFTHLLYLVGLLYIFKLDEAINYDFKKTFDKIHNNLYIIYISNLCLQVILAILFVKKMSFDIGYRETLYILTDTNLNARYISLLFYNFGFIMLGSILSKSLETRRRLEYLIYLILLINITLNLLG